MPRCMTHQINSASNYCVDYPPLPYLRPMPFPTPPLRYSTGILLRETFSSCTTRTRQGSQSQASWTETNENGWDPDLPVPDDESGLIRKSFVDEIEKLKPGSLEMARRTKDGCLGLVYERAWKGFFSNEHVEELDQIEAAAKKLTRSSAFSSHSPLGFIIVEKRPLPGDPTPADAPPAFCIRVSKYRTILRINYDLVVKLICEEKIPVVAVINGLENRDNMKKWWKRDAAEVVLQVPRSTSYLFTA